MTYLMVSDNETSGGAAIAATNLADGLCRKGINVIRLAIDISAERKNYQKLEFYPRNTFQGKAFRKFIPSFPQAIRKSSTGSHFKKLIIEKKPDVINFHNILWGKRLGFSVDMFKMASQQCRTLVTMHDMWTIKGVPYDFENIKGTEMYQKCLPFLQAHLDKNDSIESNIAQRTGLFRDNHIYFVAPSAWLFNETLRLYPFLKERTSLIPYGIDTDIFKPRNKSNAKALFGSNNGKINILASAASLSHINKGFDILVNSFSKRSDNSDVRLLLMGEDSVVSSVKFPADLEVVSFGFVRDIIFKSFIYNCADVLAFPSFADNLPNSVLESIASGTPVIGFNTCGIPDMIKPGVTGWLANNIDIDCFLQALEAAIDDIKKGKSLEQESRDFALEHFSMDRQAAGYLDLVGRISN